MSVCLYLCAATALLVAAAVLWVVASAFGVVGEIEGFMDDLGFEGFQFISGTLFRAGVLIGLAAVAILTVVTVLAAALYNLFSDLVGGVEITLVAAGVGPPAGRANGNGARRR